MAKSSKSKTKTKAKSTARKKAPAVKHAKSATKHAKPPHPKAHPPLKAKPAPKEVKAISRPLPKGAAPAVKVPQKMDKAALKKALLQERIARAQLKAKADGKRSTRGLTAKERALVKEFERRELPPPAAGARR